MPESELVRLAQYSSQFSSKSIFSLMNVYSGPPSSDCPDPTKSLLATQYLSSDIGVQGCSGEPCADGDAGTTRYWKQNGKYDLFSFLLHFFHFACSNKIT